MSGDRIDLLKKINALEEENKALHKALDKAGCFVEEYAQFACPYEIDDDNYMVNWSKCDSCGALKGQEKECWKEYFMEEKGNV